MPGTNRIGINTTSVVSVDMTTGTATSWAPNTDASSRLCPSSLNRKIFSSTTTASSTTIPTARVSPDREMMFRLRFDQSIMLKVDIIETGIEMAIIRAERPLRKKASRISTTRIMACSPVHSKLLIDCSINSALLVSTSTLTSSGSTPSILFSRSTTELAVVTTLASLWRYTFTITPSLPPTCTFPMGWATPSSTSAISSSLMGSSFRVAIIVFRI